MRNNNNQTADGNKKITTMILSAGKLLYDFFFLVKSNNILGGYTQVRAVVSIRCPSVIRYGGGGTKYPMTSD